MKSEEYVSVLFVHFLQPIFDLFQLLEDSNPKGPDELQAGMIENGYAVSEIVLSALVVESALNRTRYIRGELQEENAVATLRRLGATDLADDIEEVFVLRDIIAHNHIWKTTIHWTDDLKMFLEVAKKTTGRSDTKFKRVVDTETRLTRRLNLDAVPTRIHRGTAVVVLKKTVEVLKYLEQLGRQFVYLSQPWSVRKGNDFVPFYNWVESLS